MYAAVSGITTTDRLQRLVSTEPEEQRSARQSVWDAERAEKRAAGVVYYVRMGEFIKIGTSTNVPRRLGELYLRPDALLATEPGGATLERQRHREFADERFDRELFEPSDRLLQHIEALRA